MENQVDISQITDIRELKGYLADTFIRRDQARADELKANQDIEMIIMRINHLSPTETLANGIPVLDVEDPAK